MSETITSLTNPTVKRLVHLQGRRARRQERLYLAEGVRLIEEALLSSSPPTILVVAPALLKQTERGRALLSRLRATAPESFIAVAPAVLKHLAETESPSGILAALPYPPAPDLSTLLSSSSLLLVLDGIADPGNAGAILRTAAGANVDGVVALAGCVDLYAPKVVRASMGAHLHLTIAVDVAPEGFADALPISETLLLADAHAGEELYSVDFRGKTTIVMGGEARGATAIATLPGVRPITIPVSESSESLNVATAAAIILFEAVRQRRTAIPPRT